MNWLQKIAQDGDSIDYFSVGHGDYDEETGIASEYVVWALINGQIEVGPVSGFDEHGKEYGGRTHGTLWGHDVTDDTYKGRYEIQSGRVSIARPKRDEYRAISNALIQMLRDKLGPINEVLDF